MGTILDKIRAERERTLADAIKRAPEAALRRRAEAMLASHGEGRRFCAALRATASHGGPHLIAEMKRASPSAGLIRDDYRPAELAAGYARAGASAISVLTEPSFFQGSLDHLREARAAVKLPILRKDFIFHQYQLLEAVECGAEGVLLIVAMLTPDELRRLHVEATRFGLDCLVEVHCEEEMKAAVGLGADLIGINNRDLRTMRVDVETTFKLLPLAPRDAIVVSESGIKSREDVIRLGRAGVKAVLVGESLMRSPDPAAAAAALLGAP